MWASLKRIWTVDDLRSKGVRLVFQGVFDGLRRNGKEVRAFPLDPSEPDYQEKFCDDLLRFEPDAVLLANYPASYYLRQFGIHEFPFQRLVWILDDPNMMGDERFEDHEIVLVADPKFEQSVRERGAKRVFFLPVAAPDQITAKFRPDLECPLAYVGSIYTPVELRKKISPDHRGWVTQLIHRKVEYPARDFEELIEGEIPAKALSRRVRFLLYCEANRIYRFRYLQLLASLGLRLYGNSLWKTEIRGSALEPCFQGRLELFTDYPNLIQSAKININLRSLQGFDAPTHRDFMVPRLGGFLLSSATRLNKIDWETSDPNRQFRLNEFPWSEEKRSPQYLAEAAQYYLGHETERRDWTLAASKEIAEHHTYARRMEQLGEILDREGN